MSALKKLARATGLSRMRRTLNDRARRRRVARARKHPTTRNQLADQLRALGLAEGQCAMVHSSLSGLGFVEGGPGAVIAALRDVVGEAGTLLMPAYAIEDYSIAALKRAKVFDPAGDRSQMGKITEVFRLSPGVRRSTHYTHSICAQGPQAEYLTRDHERSITPVGPGSPFERLHELDGVILALGSAFGHITFYHLIEDWMPDFPARVYYPELLRGPIRGEDGEIRDSEYRVHDPELYLRGRIDLDPAKEREILGLFRERGIVREGRAGAGTSYLFGARKAAEFLTELAARGITIYSHP